MLKLQKIIRPTVCFIVLLAFAGTISLQSAPGRVKNTRTEVSVLNIHSSPHFMALSEENDSDESDDPYVNLTGILTFNPSSLDFNKTPSRFIHEFFTKRILSIPLYLSYRCLRL